MREATVVKTLDAETEAIDARLTIAAKSALVCTIRVGFKRDLSVCLNGGYSIDGFEQTIQGADWEQGGGAPSDKDRVNART